MTPTSNIAFKPIALKESVTSTIKLAMVDAQFRVDA